MHFIALASQEILFPTRIATRPSNPTSVNAEPYWKSELGDSPPLHASSHSWWCPLERTRLGVGRW